MTILTEKQVRDTWIFAKEYTGAATYLTDVSSAVPSSAPEGTIRKRSSVVFAAGEPKNVVAKLANQGQKPWIFADRGYQAARPTATSTTSWQPKAPARLI